MLTCEVKKRTFFLFCFFSFPCWLLAQQITIKGTVKEDAKQTPVAGASVQLKGRNQGTLTDEAGSFTMSVKDPNDTLVITSLGFVTLEVPINGRTVIDVLLKPSVSQLNDVVVVGYGSQRRKDITGAVLSVDKQRLENMPNSNFAQALEGSVAGVMVNTNGGGAEGNSLSIMIRGRKSVLATNTPLLVLDGIPYNGSISDINPQDVASMEILKDASAAAIYGSRAANGVILITTKRGTNGKPVISYDGFTGVQRISNLPDVLQGEDFYNFKVTREGLSSITLSEKALRDAGKYTDWLDLTTRTGLRSQHTLTVRGGSNNFKYYASLGYLDVKGVAENDNFKRISTRINLEATLTKWLTYGTNTQLSYNDRSGLPADFSGNYGAYTFNPLTSPYDSAGNLTVYPWAEDKFFANPLAPTLAVSLDNTYKVLTTNYLLAKVPFIKGLSYRLNVGADYQGRTINTYYGRNTRTGAQANGSLSQSNSIVRNYTVENIVNYDKAFGKHSIGLTGVYAYQYGNTSSNTLSAEGFPDDVLTFYQANVALLKDPRTSFEKETMISQMGRLNYNYDSRYMITFTVRRDGSSVFSEQNKFATLPAVAFAWNIINERFFESARKKIDNLKLRISYGALGNPAISPYQTLARLATRSYVDGNTTAAGYVPSTLGNPNLKWETSKQLNIGLDFSLLKGRVSGAIEYYNTRTSDLLLRRKISPLHGIDEVTQNIGKTANRGLELSLNTINVKTKDFTWSSTGNISFNRNKWVDVYGDGKSDTLSGYFIDYPVGVSFGYVFDGVYQLTDDTVNTPMGAVHPGYAKIRDLNGDKVINAKDRTILGKEEPDFVWGLSNTFQYKNFSLYVFVHGVQGKRETNSLLSDNNVGAGVRYTTVVKNWWTTTNPSNDFYGNIIGATKGFSVPIVESSSFIRVKDIMLSYDLPQATLGKLGLSRLRIYLETRNPFTITKWTGLDPQFTSQTSIPLQKEFLVGVNISL